MPGYESNRALKVLRLLEAAADWLSTPEIAAALDCFTGDVLPPLHRLVDQGLAERRKVGKSWCWRLVRADTAGPTDGPTD